MDQIEESFKERHSPAWAQWISDVFSPIMMPTFGMVVAMWCTNMRSLPDHSRIIATLLVAVITGLVPFLSIVILIKTGKVHTRSIADRHERILPMSIGAVCYLGAALLLKSLGAPMWLCMFFVAAAVASIIALLITFEWKISAHATGVGGFWGMTAWCVANGMADVNAMIVLSVVTVIAGAVATSRLMLQRHSIGQVMAGLALGFGCCFLLMSV